MAQELWVELIGPGVSVAIALLTINMTREKAGGKQGQQLAQHERDIDAVKRTSAETASTLAIHTTLLETHDERIDSAASAIRDVEKWKNKEEGRLEAERDLRKDSVRGRRPPQT